MEYFMVESPLHPSKADKSSDYVLVHRLNPSPSDRFIRQKFPTDAVFFTDARTEGEIMQFIQEKGVPKAITVEGLQMSEALIPELDKIGYAGSIALVGLDTGEIPDHFPVSKNRDGLARIDRGTDYHEKAAAISDFIGQFIPKIQQKIYEGRG